MEPNNTSLQSCLLSPPSLTHPITIFETLITKCCHLAESLTSNSPSILEEKQILSPYVSFPSTGLAKYLYLGT